MDHNSQQYECLVWRLVPTRFKHILHSVTIQSYGQPFLLLQMFCEKLSKPLLPLLPSKQGYSTLYYAFFQYFTVSYIRSIRAIQSQYAVPGTIVISSH